MSQETLIRSKLTTLEGLHHYTAHVHPGGIPIPLGGYGPFEHWDDFLNTVDRFRELRRFQIQRHAGIAPGIQIQRRIAPRGGGAR
jgi:hypothetical protein